MKSVKTMNKLMASVPTVVRAWGARVTRSWTTMTFFLFVLGNYAAQTGVHSQLFLCFMRNRERVNAVIEAAGVQRGFTVFQNGVLEICSGIPATHGTTCYTVYNGSSAIPLPPFPPSTPSMRCAEGLTWLENYYCNSKGEEIFYLVLQSWHLVISLLALINESVPNLIIVLVSQVLNASWSAFRVSNDLSARAVYDKVIVDGTCGGEDILSGSWDQYPFFGALIFNIITVFLMVFFSLKLMKLYSKGTLSSVGSSAVINRLLTWRLWMRVFLQFTMFFVLASAAIWYDKRTTGVIAPYSENSLYDAGFYVVAIILLPWLLLGQHSVSKEDRALFLVHAFLSIILLVISGLWFGSALFRYEYWTWQCFAGITSAADVLLVITCVISVICRLNFGKGLAHYLVVERALRAAGFTNDVFQDPQADSGAKHASSPGQPEPQTHFTIHHSNLKHSKSTSECSVASSAIATWLSPALDQDPEKCEPHAAKERPASIIIISRENMVSHGAQSVSDDESISTIA